MAIHIMPGARTTADDGTKLDLVGLALGASTWVRAALGTSAFVFFVGVVGGLAHLWWNRGAVQILPAAGAGADAAQMALQVGEQLAAIAGGAESGVDPDETVQQTSSATLPSVTIPGTTIPLATAVELMQTTWLGGQDRVRVMMTSEGSAHQLRVQVDGWHLSGRTVVTEPKTTVAEALLDGAEQIFALLRPLGAASYFATRYPDRSIALAASVIRDPTSTPKQRATAYRVWALVLREQGDVNGAQRMLWQAYQLAKDPAEQARILTETAYTQGMAGDWHAAELTFRDALTRTPDSPITKSRLAFALMEQGSFDDAEQIFEQLQNADPLWVEPQRGLAQIALRRWDVWEARARYRQAILVASSAAERALVDRDVGDLYAGLGCMKEARRLYRQAGAIDACYAGPGGEGRCRGLFGDEDRACPLLALAPPSA